MWRWEGGLILVRLFGRLMLSCASASRHLKHRPLPRPPSSTQACYWLLRIIIIVIIVIITTWTIPSSQPQCRGSCGRKWVRSPVAMNCETHVNKSVPFSQNSAAYSESLVHEEIFHPNSLINVLADTGISH
jgi:hypothetical protein